MSKPTWLAAALGLLALAPASHASDDTTPLFETVDPTTAQHVRVRALGTAGDLVQVAVELNGQSLYMDLVPQSIRTSYFKLMEQVDDGRLVEVDPGPVTTYRGTVVGSPGSEVRASLFENGLGARITLADEREFWIQPVEGQPLVAGTDHVLYTSADVVGYHGECGADELPNNFQKFVPTPPTGTLLPAGARAGTAVDIATVGCDADFQYYNIYGSSSMTVSNRIQSILFTMNAQYETQVQITHEISTIIVRTTSNNPYTSSDAGTLLGQLQSEWQNNQGAVVRDVAELFTGKNLSGSTIGIAWLGSICGSLGYNVVSNYTSSLSCLTDLSAHELGHNWNADHCTCSTKTMNPSITCANKFSVNKTKPDILGFKASLSCLNVGNIFEVYNDDFESGDYAAGGWVLQNTKPIIRAKASFKGVYGARLRHTTWIEKAIDASGLSNIKLSYARRTKGYESGEELAVEWWDGAIWRTLETTSSTLWGESALLLGTGANNNPNLKIRFRTNADSNRERTDVDNVKVTGS